MCRICAPILGWTLAHTEAQCPLSQASACPNCGPRTHFAAHCPRLAKATPTMQPSVTQPPPKDENIIMTDNVKEYEAYLTLHKIDFADVQDRTKGKPQEYKNQLLRLVELAIAAKGKKLARPLAPCLDTPVVTAAAAEAAAPQKKVRVRRQ